MGVTGVTGVTGVIEWEDQGEGEGKKNVSR